MRIMTIDPSKSLGWCMGEFGKPPKFGTYKLPNGAFQVRALALDGFLTSLIKGNGIVRVYAETPIMPKITTFQTMMAMAGLAAAISITCARLGTNFHYLDMQKWRSGFLGLTQAPKMPDILLMPYLVDMNDPAAVAAFKKSGGMNDDRKREARRRWLKQHTMEVCRKRGFNVEDDDMADALAMFLHLQERDGVRSLQSELDLEGLDI